MCAYACMRVYVRGIIYILEDLVLSYLRDILTKWSHQYGLIDVYTRKDKTYPLYSVYCCTTYCIKGVIQHLNSFLTTSELFYNKSINRNPSYIRECRPGVCVCKYSICALKKLQIHYIVYAVYFTQPICVVQCMLYVVHCILCM